MTKKDIFSKILLFIFIMIFMVIFKGIFSSDNTLVGVTSITAMLMFLSRDLTASPIKMTLKLLGINILIGIASFIAASNVWLGIPINFGMCFFLGYSLVFNLNTPLYMPFLLEYLFLVSSPVDISHLPLRLSALIVGSLLIMFLQLLFNRNKLKKAGNKILISLCDELKEEITLVKENHDLSEVQNKIHRLIIQLRRIIYDQREDKFYFTEEGRIKLNLSISLEKLSIIIARHKDKEHILERLDELEIELNEIKSCLEDASAIPILDTHSTQLIEKLHINDTMPLELLEFLGTVASIRDYLSELLTLKNDEYNIVKRLESIPTNFAMQNFTLKHLRDHAMKYSYAMRIAIGVTTSFFISGFFNLPEGRWLAFTAYAIIIPIYEQSKTKAKARLLGTIIGAIIIVILFNIFPVTSVAPFCLIIAGFISNFITNYKYTTICVTISAICSAVLANPSIGMTLTVERLFFVAAGIILAILINKFILPYRFEDTAVHLKSMYKRTIHEMLEYTCTTTKDVSNSIAMKNLLIFSSLIDDQLRLNNESSEVPSKLSFLDDCRLFFINIYALYMWLIKYYPHKSDCHLIVQNLHSLIKYTPNTFTSTEVHIKEQINDTETTLNKITLTLILQLFIMEHQISEKYSQKNKVI